MSCQMPHCNRETWRGPFCAQCIGFDEDFVQQIELNEKATLWMVSTAMVGVLAAVVFVALFVARVALR